MLSIRSTRRMLLTSVLIIAAAIGVAGCERAPPPAESPVAGGPAQAVTRLADDLRRNDLVAYARHALPPTLHARIESAWRQGRTIWPLTELPLDDRLPRFITVLSAPDAEKTLLATYNLQFAGADRELRSAAATLGLFATQYVRGAQDYSPAEREHYVQVIAALSQWGQRAPLGDRKLGRAAITQLVAAARLTGLATPVADTGTTGEPRLGTPQRLGMTRSLKRLGPFLARFKQVLRGYGLDLDAALASVEATAIEQTGDRARVRLRYTLAGQPIEAVVAVERRQGRWYLSDLLRHARAEAEAPAPPDAPPP